MHLAGPAAPTHRSVIELLAEARARTVLIVSTLSDEEMRQQPDPAVESILTELIRIIEFEQRWLLNEPAHTEPSSYDEWFDAMTELRQRVIERVDAGGGSAGASPGVERYRLVVEHEYRRNEAMFETLQALSFPYRAPLERSLPWGRALADPGYMTRFAGGIVEIGSGSESAVWPEDQPRHPAEVEPFWIDVMPVTNADFMTFIASGGYQNRDFWSDDGWQWRAASAVEMPGGWSRIVDGVWHSQCLGREVALDQGAPVGQVSCHEAEAFAAFVGKRLPSEIEWETAAGWDPETQTARSYPWGNMSPTLHVANLDQFGLMPAPVGAYPGNVSPIGCYGMIGDVWEWTSPVTPSEARGPKPDLLEGSKSVLRGGSWATRPGAIRVSVRRPAEPGARHLFTGFRCARSA